MTGGPRLWVQGPVVGEPFAETKGTGTRGRPRGEEGGIWQKWLVDGVTAGLKLRRGVGVDTLQSQLEGGLSRVTASSDSTCIAHSVLCRLFLPLPLMVAFSFYIWGKQVAD